MSLPASTVYTDELRSYDGIRTMLTKDGKPPDIGIGASSTMPKCM